MNSLAGPAGVLKLEYNLKQEVKLFDALKSFTNFEKHFVLES